MSTATGCEPVMSTWAGLPNFGCPICAFSTPDAASFETHITHNHVNTVSPLFMERMVAEALAVSPGKGRKAGKDEG